MEGQRTRFGFFRFSAAFDIIQIRAAGGSGRRWLWWRGPCCLASRCQALLPDLPYKHGRGEGPGTTGLRHRSRGPPCCGCGPSSSNAITHLVAHAGERSASFETMCSAAALQILKSIFGFDGFLPGQIEAISAVMDGEDVVVRLPTNGGKSVCFLMPPLLRGPAFCAVVVSPLKALMEEQVFHLKVVNMIKHEAILLLLRWKNFLQRDSVQHGYCIRKR